MNNKKELRAMTLGARRTFKKEIVEINGNKFEVRQPTIGERGQIRNAAMKLDDTQNEKMKFDMFNFMLCAVVALTYVPGTDEKVFTDEDIDTLKEAPAGGWFDDLSAVATKMCNVKSDEVKKPSGETKNESPSSE